MRKCNDLGRCKAYMGRQSKAGSAHRLLMSYLTLLLTPSLCLLQPLPLLAMDPESPTSGVEHRNQLSSKEQLPTQGLASSQLSLVSAELLTCLWAVFHTACNLSSSFFFLPPSSIQLGQDCKGTPPGVPTNTRHPQLSVL